MVSQLRDSLNGKNKDTARVKMGMPLLETAVTIHPVSLVGLASQWLSKALCLQLKPKSWVDI